MESNAALPHIEAIRQLKARYFRCFDTKDWAGYADVFTDDARMEAGDDSAIAAAFGFGPATETERVMRALVGGEKISAFIAAALGGARTVHHGHTAEIEIVGPSEATGVWAMADIVERPGLLMRGEGHYHDRYRLDAGRWRIAATRLSRLRMTYFRPDEAGRWREIPCPPSPDELPAAIRPLRAGATIGESSA